MLGARTSRPHSLRSKLRFYSRFALNADGPSALPVISSAFSFYSPAGLKSSP
jgi:hypothetical protein